MFISAITLRAVMFNVWLAKTKCNKTRNCPKLWPRDGELVCTHHWCIFVIFYTLETTLGILSKIFIISTKNFAFQLKCSWEMKWCIKFFKILLLIRIYNMFFRRNIHQCLYPSPMTSITSISPHLALPILERSEDGHRAQHYHNEKHFYIWLSLLGKKGWWGW